MACSYTVSKGWNEYEILSSPGRKYFFSSFVIETAMTMIDTKFIIILIDVHTYIFYPLETFNKIAILLNSR